MTDHPALSHTNTLWADTPLTRAALALGDVSQPSDRNAEIIRLGERAGLLLVHGGDDFDPHFADPDSSTTRCGQDVTRWLNDELTARISVLCGACEKAATEPTEGDLLIAELAKVGRRAYVGGEGGVSYLIMAAAPDAPDDPTFPYDHPHVLMYAGEQADRPASEHVEPWSAHLHGADGDYVATIGANFSSHLDADADAARLAREVTDWLNAFHGTDAA
ncbi:hypothetical protein [Streptomyces sp. NPDC058548]|uniref:hypothetical protein n=1 Tax=Streptomyces sp. NPDC058548 TaxID=3346545 RepID=UPI00365DD197